jgi:hypothetical protein
MTGKPIFVLNFSNRDLLGKREPELGEGAR